MFTLRPHEFSDSPGRDHVKQVWACICSQGNHTLSLRILQELLSQKPCETWYFCSLWSVSSSTVKKRDIYFSQNNLIWPSKEWPYTQHEVSEVCDDGLPISLLVWEQTICTDPVNLLSKSFKLVEHKQSEATKDSQVKDWKIVSFGGTSFTTNVHIHTHFVFLFLSF